METELSFLLKKIISAVILPPALPILLGCIGVLLMASRRRWGLVLCWLGIVTSVLLSTPALVNHLTVPLEDIPVLDLTAAKTAQAIVILGAGQRRHMPEYGGPGPNRLAIERLRYGARIARTTRLPVLVSGGARKNDTPEAVLMAASLQEDFGITARWLEDKSLDTSDNASLSAVILRQNSIKRIILVTHAAHMQRSRNAFVEAGIEVITAPTGFLGNPDASDELEFAAYLPSASAAYSGWYALHEWVGLLAQTIRHHFLRQHP